MEIWEDKQFCDECKKKAEPTVYVADIFDVGGAVLCKKCLEKALAMLSRSEHKRKKAR